MLQILILLIVGAFILALVIKNNEKNHKCDFEYGEHFMMNDMEFVRCSYPNCNMCEPIMHNYRHVEHQDITVRANNIKDAYSSIMMQCKEKYPELPVSVLDIEQY